MVNYKCLRCGFSHKVKKTFINHLNRKYICDPKINDISIKDVYNYYFKSNQKIDINNIGKSLPKLANSLPKLANCLPKLAKNNPIIETIKEYYCQYCDKKFKHSSSKTKHEQNRCKVKKKIEEDNKKVNILKKEMSDHMEKQRELEKRLKNQEKEFMKRAEREKEEFKKMLTEEFTKQLKMALVKQDFTMQPIDQSKNIQNNNNLNLTIKLNSFDKTDYSHIKDEDYLEFIRRGNMGLPDLIKKLHFNPEKPENHNIFISNIKSDYIKVYEDGRWNTKLQYETINMIVQDNANIIEDLIEKWFDSNHEFCVEFKWILDKYPRFLNRLSDSKYVGKKVEQEVKLVMFNFRDMVIKHSKKLLKN